LLWLLSRRGGLASQPQPASASLSQPQLSCLREQVQKVQGHQESVIAIAQWTLPKEQFLPVQSRFIYFLTF